jgi:hypothetical protein
MIRVGRYDAFDKWEILCRYWEDHGSVADLGVDKFNRPLLPGWHSAAAWGGAAFCFDYIRLKAIALGSGVPAEAPGSGAADDVNREMSRLLHEIGQEKLQGRVGELAQTITAAGFRAPFSNGLSPQCVDRMREVFKQGALERLKWTEDAGEIPTIKILRDQAARFPVDAIKHKRNVLCMFCAWFYGRSDVIHVHDACPDQVTLVDYHAPSLEEMKLIYPPDWTYVHEDYKEFLRQADQDGLTYDLIVCDAFKDLGEKVGWDSLPTIMRLCSDTFITNYFPEMFGALGVEPDDLDGLSRAATQRTGVDVVFNRTLERSNGVYWVVMRKR